MSQPASPLPIILNPEAVGNPDKTPIVRLDANTAPWLPLADWLRDPANGGCPECTGINWFHDENCPKADSGCIECTGANGFHDENCLKVSRR